MVLVSGAQQRLGRTATGGGRDALDVERQVHQGHVDHGGVPLRVALTGRATRRGRRDGQLELEQVLAERPSLGQRRSGTRR